ncbi:MAG: uridylate kinase [Deltaproteobacteria bacterium]|nr:uridylate kinase [Deltaproteobacteria bacterium]
MTTTIDNRPHLDSLLMRESLLDKDLAPKTDAPVFKMLPESIVIKIGGQSIFDKGIKAVGPVVEILNKTLDAGNKLIIGTGGGARTRHVFSIGIDLGMPTGVLAQLAMADALGTAHMLGTLLAPKGVVAIPPEMFGHLLPLFLHSAPGVIYNGVPPYSIWEQPDKVGKIPPHRTDAGCLLLAECFGSKKYILVKDVDGVYEEDPKKNPEAKFIGEIRSDKLKDMHLQSLPFDRVLLDIMENTKLIKRFQVVNGTKPDMLAAAIEGDENVGTTVYAP